MINDEFIDEINDEFIDKINKKLDLLRKTALNDKNFAFDKPMNEFAKYMRPLTTQMSGSRFENKIAYDLDLQKSKDKDRGDSFSKNKNYFEIKASLITTTNKNLNIVQIRPWQDVNYIVFVYDFNNNNGHFLYIKNDQMHEEINLSKNALGIKFSNAHGTKKSNYNNDNVELRSSILYNSELCHKLIKKYSIEFDDLKNITMAI
jgi:hypothetical protein